MRTAWARLVVVVLGTVGVPATAAAQAPCEPDDALTELAAAVAGFARDHGGRAPDDHALSRLLRASGSSLPSVHLRVLPAGEAPPPGPRRAPPPGPRRCGTAEASRGPSRWRVEVEGRSEATARVATRTNGGVDVHLELAGELRDAEAFVLGPDAAARRIELRPAPAGASVRLEAAELPARLQISATDAHGPHPVATLDLPLHAAEAAQLRALLGPAPSPPTWRATPGRPLARLLASREAAGAPPLRANRLLDELGVEHARAMCRAGRVAHVVDPRRGDLEARAARRGLYARSLGEAVARSRSADAAVEAMLSSPSHHALVVDQRWTDLGVGVGTDASGRACVAVVLAAWPRLR